MNIVTDMNESDLALKSAERILESFEVSKTQPKWSKFLSQTFYNIRQWKNEKINVNCHSKCIRIKEITK